MTSATNAAFIKVTESANKVAKLLVGIAMASNEQAEGIEQINRAVVEMDKVVQQVAAGAEESASSSEQMNAQSMGVRIAVGDLVRLIDGGNSTCNGNAGSNEKSAEHGAF